MLKKTKSFHVLSNIFNLTETRLFHLYIRVITVSWIIVNFKNDNKYLTHTRALVMALFLF